ncbi:MAG: DUF3185 family protein [Verrucomicrobia bacterium]|nr:DUF3185 family protein [Verrucomicrobiota bacterium]MDE3099683.1 DUF3185 family protein [Verrucomicrobiota bacterium]
MIKAIGLALLAAGIAFLIYGIQESRSFDSSVSRAFTGNPTNRTLWFTAGGIGGIVLGGALALLPSRKR